jgi:hypothetical protein
MISKLKVILRQYKIFILLAALVPILGFILFLYRLPKEPPANPVFGPLPAPKTEYGVKVKKEINYQFSLPKNAFAKLPRQLSVYQIKKLSEQEVINRFARLASELGFSVKPTVQSSGDLTFYVWQEGSNYLKVNSQTGQFIFKGEFPLTLGPVGSQEAASLAKEKLVNWELLSETSSPTIGYFRTAGLELEPVTNPNLATVYEIVFSFAVDDYPLIGFGPAQDVALAWVTKEGQLIKLNYFSHQIDQEKMGTYPIKPADVAIAEIQQGQGKILSAKTQAGIETNIDPKNPIKSINLTSVELAYYESVEKQEYLQPIYVFKGTAVLEDDEVLEVFLYLPAVSSEWLIQASPTSASKFKTE